ncbi:MAG: c-type cytochrome [Chloroflexi bacterium]|nr:c-type cytochrome [Chloroflexota bacterium]
MIEPQRHNARYGRFFILALLFLLLLATAVSAQEPAIPQTAPDAAVGLSLFADRCANCHGPAGQGDGELAARLEAPPADITDPEFRRTRVPADMFTAITNGNLASGMPPFGPDNQTDPINESNRWDLVAAVYSLATPPETLAFGQIVYEDNCAACHGDTGLGDGPDAAQDTPPTDLTDLDYWFSRSNETVFTAVANQVIPVHDYDLTDDELWAVVDYGRTFSYRYASPASPAGPIAAATISGIVTNASTGELLTEGQVRLRAFDTNFQLTQILTETLQADGSYSFTVTDAQPNWVYLAGVNYQNVGFSSDAARLNAAEPSLSLPITVFEPTTDPAAVVLDQLHILVNFANDALQIDEFYIASNISNNVFVGETGDPAAGTLQFSLPQNATNVTFQRALGEMDSTIPANEVIQTAVGWADTFPMNPGPSGTNLIISYELPYTDSASLARLVHYRVTNANLIMPDAGVTASGAGFENRGVQDMGGSRFATYNRVDVPPDTTLELALNGRPQITTTSASSAIAPRNQTSDLIIGGVFLVVVVGLAGFTVRSWRAAADAEYDDDDDEPEVAGDVEDDKQRLLQAIVTLDIAFEDGQIAEADYTARRAELKEALAEIWN